MRILPLLAPFVAAVTLAGPALAEDGRSGGKLLLTDGISTVEGSAGGGLSTWAVIAGNETERGIGASAHATLVALPDFTLRAGGAALGVYDRIELSYTRQEFDTDRAGAALGLGRGFTFAQDVYGAKLRVAGDAVWAQDTLLPQLAVGVQHKVANQGAVIAAVGGRDRSGTDYYASATKLVLSQGLLLNATARWTRANQFGLLGHGGDREDGYRLQPEGSVAKMLSRRLVVGAEYRAKSDRLGFARENDAWDAFVAWAPQRNVTFTAAYVDLGDIATFRRQRGLFVQLQGAF